MSNTLKQQQAERSEKAKAAVKVFRGMLPSLNGFVRALSGNPKARIEIHPTSNGGTDGQTIYYRPPIALGDKRPHERDLCDKRGEDGLQRCEACRIREGILTVLYHEMAHIAFNTFEPVSDRHAGDFTRRAAREHGSKYAQAIVDRLSLMPERQRNNYMVLAGMISPFLPFLLNGLEDARVNSRMFAARPGTRAMFEADIRSTFENGFENYDGTVKWSERPLNAQISIGLYVLASGYDYTGWFHEKVEQDLKDPKLVNICEQVAGAKDAGDVYGLSFLALARLRELGYCLSERDPDVEEEDEPEPEPEAEPEPESADEPEDSAEGSEGSDESDRSPDGDGMDSPEAPEEGDGEQPESEGTPEEDGEADSDAGPADGDAPDEAEADSEGDSGDADQGDGGSPDDETGDSAESEGASDDATDQGVRDGGAEGEGSDDGPGEAQDDGAVSDEESAGSDEASSQDSSEADASDQQSDGVDSDGEEGPSGGSPDEDGAASADQSPSGDSLGAGDRSEDSSVADDTEPVDGDGADDAGEGQPEGDVTDGTAMGSAGGPGRSDEGVPSDVPAGDSADVDSVRDDEASAAEAGEGDDGRDEVSDDGDQSPDSDGPIDLGPAKKGGWAEPLPEYGDERDVQGDLDRARNHEGDEVAGSDQVTTETRAESEEVAREVVQGVYFETGSIHVAGVVEHRPSDEKPGPHWRAYKRLSARDRVDRGIDGDFAVPESVLAPALQRMRVVFSENRRASDTRNLKAGRVNARALGKRAWGEDERLFKRKQRPGKRDYSVVIGMDVSGSTAGMELAIEKRAVMAQAELLNRMGVRFAILAHSNGMGGIEGVEGMTLRMYHIKQFDEPWTDKTRANLSTIASGNGNLDGHSMEFYRKMLDRETTTDRIIMYYTDGAMPASNYDEELAVLQRELQVCRQKGYTVMGVGIRTDSPTEHGLETVVVEQDSDIVAVIRFLEKRLERTVR